MKLGLTMLCENPLARTGLTTLFHEFVKHSLALYPNVNWVLFAGPNQPWTIEDPRLEIIRRFPANDRLRARLVADHFKVPVVAQNHGVDVLLTIGFVPIRKRTPVAMHVFSLQHLDPVNRVGVARQFYRSWLTRFSWPNADLLITNSDFARTQLLSVHPRFAHRTVRSYEGLQHDQFTASGPADEAGRLRDRFGLQSGYLLWISNFYPYKQASALIDAFARLPSELRRRHPMVFVGGDWCDQVRVAKEQAARLGVTDDVKFIGWIEDEWLAPLYRNARLFCLPSREETFGRCVIEAMACGTPCVVNDIPIMREVTAGHAQIVDFRNATEAGSALVRGLTDEAWRNQVIPAGLQRAHDFSFERLTAERITAVSQLVKTRKR
jgi:glycosyltransferase involved in cell wall biosynthesis